MNQVLAKNWWALALRGVLAILFAITAFVMPGLTLGLLLLVFGVYLVVDGIFALIAGVRAAERHERWGMLAFEGLVDLAAGVVIVMWPAPSLLAFIYFAAFWAIVTGSALLASAIRLHREHGEWMLLVSGGLSLIWGVLVLLFPAAGVLVWAWWIGTYALLFGISMIVLSLRLKNGIAP